MSESRMTWIGIIITSLGLVTSVYYNGHILKVTRIENELNCYLNLNERYHRLVFTLVHNKTFRHTTEEDLGDEKYVIYELFDLMATIKATELYTSPNLKADWDRKIQFLFTKPAVRLAWQMHQDYINKIYSSDFIAYIHSVMGE